MRILPKAPARRAALCGLLGLLLSGCAYYSFTGATIPSHLSTVAVPLAEDVSASPLTGLSDQFTQMLVERFVGQTRLALEQDETEADAVLSARLERYDNQPTSVGGGDQATRNRVNLSVAVRYYDRVRDEVILERTFSGYGEYDPLAEGLSGEQQAAQAALTQIADDIFTAATSNW